VLLGACSEGALLIARADDIATARREVGQTLDYLLTALTSTGRTTPR
jgi:hypothetical protein